MAGTKKPRRAGKPVRRARPPHGPTDEILGALFEAISRPERAEMVFTRLSAKLYKIKNQRVRLGFEGFISAISGAVQDPARLRIIGDELERWQDRNFPNR